jgi:hypothetical protein
MLFLPPPTRGGKENRGEKIINHVVWDRMQHFIDNEGDSLLFMFCGHDRRLVNSY